MDHPLQFSKLPIYTTSTCCCKVVEVLPNFSGNDPISPSWAAWVAKLEILARNKTGDRRIVDKCVLNHIRLEAASNSAKPITEVTALLRHAPLWNDVREILGRARVPSQISMEESSTVVRALLVLSFAVLEETFKG